MSGGGRRPELPIASTAAGCVAPSTAIVRLDDRAIASAGGIADDWRRERLIGGSDERRLALSGRAPSLEDSCCAFR